MRDDILGQFARMRDEMNAPTLPPGALVFLGRLGWCIATTNAAALLLIQMRTRVNAAAPDPAELGGVRKTLGALIDEAESYGGALADLVTMMSGDPALVDALPASILCAYEAMQELRSAGCALAEAVGIEHDASASPIPRLRVVPPPET
jgi:hypothetical protein